MSAAHTLLRQIGVPDTCSSTESGKCTPRGGFHLVALRQRNEYFLAVDIAHRRSMALLSDALHRLQPAPDNDGVLDGRYQNSVFQGTIAGAIFWAYKIPPYCTKTIQFSRFYLVRKYYRLIFCEPSANIIKILFYIKFNGKVSKDESHIWLRSPIEKPFTMVFFTTHKRSTKAYYPFYTGR